MLCDRVWTDARLLTFASSNAPSIEKGMIAAKDGVILYVGSIDDAPQLEARETIQLNGRWVTPGLIDCHTHLVYGGDRAHEFELRLTGATYEEIARAGGGILSTVRATRAESEESLIATALSRLDRLIAEGVTTIEIKSGYGLSTDAEIRQLRAARQLARHRQIDVSTTFLGAHAIPPEYASDRSAYVDLICGTMMNAVATEGLAEAVDVFCEKIAFTPEETARILDTARKSGLRCKLHADQLSDSGGAGIAARFGALSADHLEYASEAGIQAMADAGTVAVMLPGAFHFLREKQVPPIELCRRHGTHLAIATDCNPGSSPLTSILLAMNMAAVLFRMTVNECLAGVTREAARALGRLGHVGTLEVGKYCDLAIWDVERLCWVCLGMGFNPLYRRVWRGA